MKVCPKCKSRFSDDLNYCLDDGSTLRSEQTFGAEDTLSTTDQATLNYQIQQTARQNPAAGSAPIGKPARNSTLLPLVGCGGVFLLLAALAGGGFLLLRQKGGGSGIAEPNRVVSSPVYTPKTPSPTPQPNIKVEILEKVKNNEGTDFLKCKLTNVGSTIARPFAVSLNFYKGDVQINNNSALVKFKYLKPGQSIPVWIGLYGTVGYTSVRVKEPVSTFPMRANEQKAFPELVYTETEMTQSSSSGYKVSGIVENQNDDPVSPELFVVFYDENSEIIGIEVKRMSDLQKNGKTKFEASISKRDLFGKPKKFEIIAMTD